MNCYYSNLIEGHDTHPIDIERALKDDYSKDAQKRDLQLEAKAHITVQEWIDGGGLKGRAALGRGIREIHLRFCELLPEDLLGLEDPANQRADRGRPWRTARPRRQVGGHIPISAPAVPRFLNASKSLRQSARRSPSSRFRGRASPPFVDAPVPRRQRPCRPADVARDAERSTRARVVGRPRVARNAEDYKGHLALCDETRRNDLDGRGTLSEEALTDFTRFFLTTCIDQVSFMESLMQPDQLRTRILLWAEEEIRLKWLPPKAGAILEALLYRGARAWKRRLRGRDQRTPCSPVCRRPHRSGSAHFRSTRAPLRLAFPAKLAARWMPGLFPTIPPLIAS